MTCEEEFTDRHGFVLRDHKPKIVVTPQSDPTGTIIKRISSITGNNRESEVRILI